MRSFLKGALVGGTAAAVLAGGTVLAGTGIGGVFNLGQANTVTAKTTLTGGVGGDAQLVVNNTSTSAGSGAIRGVGGTSYPAIYGANTGTGPGLQASSAHGTGLRVSNNSATLPSAYVSNASGGPGIRIDTTGGGAPLVVNSSTKVANLNADLLDGLNAGAFSRLLAMATDDDSGNALVAGDNFILDTGFTPAADGRCLVTVSTQISGPATTDLGPFYRIAIQRGAAAPVDDGLYVHYFPPLGSSGYSDDLTRSATFDVTAGTSVRFGAYLGSPAADWVSPPHFPVIHTTYMCTTIGTLAAARPSQARHTLRQQRQQRRPGR